VASIPDAPPLTKGLTVGHTPSDCGFFSSPISSLLFWIQKLLKGNLGFAKKKQRNRERERERKGI
jgi:hypothetical protein